MSDNETGDIRNGTGSAGGTGESSGDGERQRLERLLDSRSLAKVLGDELIGSIDPATPIADVIVRLAAVDDEIDPASEDWGLDTLWRAARAHSIPITAAVAHVLDDSVRGEALRRLLDRWSQVPKSDRELAGTLRDALADPDTPAIFLGALHPALVRAARGAAVERSSQSVAGPQRVAGDVREEDAEAKLPRTAATPAECEALVRGLESVDTGEAYQAIARLADGGADAVAWLVYESERDFTLSEAMLHRLRALLRLDPARGVRLAGGLFRSDDGVSELDSEEIERYIELLDLLLDSGLPEVYPLLVFVFEPAGKLRLPREAAGRLRERIRAHDAFRVVRRLLRKLQHGEPVLVPSGVDFERFVGAELQRLGYRSGSPDPQVIADIRTRWIHAMHEDLLYLSPADVPEISFDEALGERSEGESVSSHVESQSQEDPDWILKAAAEGGRPRIVSAYNAQEAAYREAGLERLHRRQLQFTVRDLVVRGARLLSEGDGERAELYARAAAELDSSDPFAAALAAAAGNRD